MIIVTTPSIQGKTIAEYKGIVTGDAIMGANIFRDVFASVRDIVGGRSGAYEKELNNAKEAAFADIVAKAEALGADAIVGVDIDFETIGTSMLMVSVSGTAVKL